MSFGRFSGRASSKPIGDINVTPLVDVMLVLLVIFILTAPLLTSAVRLDLPSAQGLRSDQPPQAIQIALDARGQIHLDDQPLDAQALADRLQQLAQQHPDTEVQLRVDQSVPYGQVLEVIGLAQQAGLNRMGFVGQVPRARP